MAKTKNQEMVDSLKELTEGFCKTKGVKCQTTLKMDATGMRVTVMLDLPVSGGEVKL